MESSQAPIGRTAMEYGVMSALSVFLITIVFHYAGWAFDSTVKSLLSMAMPVIFAYMAVTNYRDKLNGGIASFGRAFSVGLLMYVVYGLLISPLNYVFMEYMAPDAMEEQFNLAYQKIYDSGAPEEMVEQQIKMISWMMKPGILALITVFSTPFIGALISLIIAAILKRAPKNA